MERLIKAGASVDFENSDGNTPLSVTASSVVLRDMIEKVTPNIEGISNEMSSAYTIGKKLAESGARNIGAAARDLDSLQLVRAWIAEAERKELSGDFAKDKGVDEGLGL